MGRRIMLIPVSTGVGLTSVSVGLVRALEQKAVKVNFFKPIAQPRKDEHGPEKSTVIVKQGSAVTPPMPFDLSYAEQMIGDGKGDDLLEEIVERFESAVADDEVAIIEGMVPTRLQPYAGRVNREIAQTLGADIVFVLTPGNDTNEQLEDRLEIAAGNYGTVNHTRVLGCIFNKVNAPLDEQGRARADLVDQHEPEALENELNRLASLPIFRKHPFMLLGSIPWDFDLVAPRVIDLSNYLKAEIINAGDMEHRRLRRVTFCARTVSNILNHFTPGALLVTPGDRSDVLVAACLSAMNGTKIGAILLTGGFKPEPRIMALCEQAMETGLPILATTADTWRTSLLLHNFNMEVPSDDEQRIDKVKQHNANHIDPDWLDQLAVGVAKTRKLSPPAFRYLLTDLARKANKTIVLPEGNEPRTIKAAAICGERGIAKTVLLGEREEIERIAAQQGVELNDNVTIIEPQLHIDKYVAPMVELRKGKGLTEVVAQEQLQDNVVLGTMMLAQNEVDGLVSGAVHTTANTIRPPLQLIKTAPGSSLVSSVFFMLLPDQVLVYGDCAINPDPTAEQLADIAIQSADSAAAFGIEPRVAMISYSTGTSGQGADVEKVREATKLAQQKRPDLDIDGPLQYDAAIMENVAKKKAPDSKVAGKATVFVFPDLNTGNTTYKAVQRSAELISIGPMLQGMRKPVNDLSRGALVEDIVFTIALTAIQAQQIADQQR
ncbi:phosphate acetyltransferase [Pseudoalteromonas sp. A25]|uniref:phosphate acetyltransferase n=1 Tax=Pseudoalteromonas sp. A25 TaxID=116092 RepID=UPI001260A3B8|nr:phosphate acetyltransferase [Pseudoalteromonas sp. A25]BBN81375.1 phosphate acetyltransferase [Pseudoalteromonas sp. A25]